MTFLQNHHPPTVFPVMITDTFCLPKTNQPPHTQGHPAHYSLPPFSDKPPPNYPFFPSTCPLFPTPEEQMHTVFLPEIITLALTLTTFSLPHFKMGIISREMTCLGIQT